MISQYFTFVIPKEPSRTYVDKDQGLTSRAFLLRVGFGSGLTKKFGFRVGFGYWLYLAVLGCTGIRLHWAVLGCGGVGLMSLQMIHEAYIPVIM